MDNWQRLNEIYRPLHEKGCILARTLRAQGFDVCLTYCNGHEIRRCGRWQTEYFPMPELELQTAIGPADLGLRLDGSVWCELHLSRARALKLDYSALSAAYGIEVYGAENYLEDFYHPSLCTEAVAARIAASAEQDICIQAELGDVPHAADTMHSLLRTVEAAG